MKKLLLSLLAPFAIYAQTSQGSIAGLVSDPSGAAITGVTITVTDLDRNTNIKAESNDTGFYIATPLPPGRYRVAAEKQGFRRFVLEPFPLQTQQKATLDIALAVGAVSESVTVSGSAQLIETSTSTLSSVIENKKIVDLPLNGRNVYSLAALTPGVYGWRPASGNGGVGEGFESIGRFTINGGRDSSNAVLMDGVPVTVNANTNNMNANTAVPSIEGVQEFRVQTNAFSAEYGRTGGGVLTIVTKSGTNELHGDLFHFMRNSVLDANNYFANAVGRPLGSFKRNEFGVSAGGPVVIPKLYNGKNRTFFFNTYEGRRIRSAALARFTLPTDAQMAGDFSQTLDAAGRLRVIHDPMTTGPDPDRPGQFVRTAFPGNRIPPTRFDPVAVNAQKFYTVKPNDPGLPFTGLQNFVFQGANKGSVNRATSKVDHNITASQRIFARYTIFNNETSQPEYWSGPGCPDGGCFSNAERQQNVGVDYSNTISPSTLLTVRAGFARSILNRGSWHLGFRPSSLGLPASVEQGADLLVFPQFGVEDVTPVGLQHHWNFRSANQSYTVSATLNKVQGRHNIKYGTENRLHLINHMQAPWQLAFNFARGFTQRDPRAGATTTSGYGYASYLLGTGSGGSVVNGIRPALSSQSYGFYVQDDFKLSRKLTLNLGLRWDFETGVTERYNRFAVFDPDVTSPLAGPTRLPLKGGYLFPGSSLGRRGLRDIEWSKIAPRIGLAYQLMAKTVIRAGYGMFYLPAPYGANFYGTPPFSASTPWVTTNDGGLTPQDPLRNPFPNGILQPEGARNGLNAALGQGFGAPVPATMTTGYNQQWNFAIQQALANNTAIEIAYAGNKGTKLPLGWQMDQLDPSLIRPELGILDNVPNPFFGIIRVGGLSNPTVQRGQLLTPYPQYPGASFAAVGQGNTNFHSLQMKFEKRFAAGASTMVAYTWAKTLSDGGDNAWASAGTRNFYCRACEKSLSPYDQRHRLVTSFTYELPFGKGKALAGGMHPIANLFFGNWQMNGIVTLNTGLPLQFNVPSNTSFSFGGGQRPDVTGSEANLFGQRTIQRWFDTTQFRLPAQYTFGNMGRMHPSIRSDRVENIDFSIFKDFRVKERIAIQFRAESFNMFNHVNFSDPNTTVNSTTFGQSLGQANPPRQTQFALKVIF